MNFSEFCINLREDLLEQISGIKNSNGYFSWDDTTPNSIIKNRLETITKKYIDQSQEFGIYVVTRYSSCELSSLHNEYPIEDKYDLDIKYKDPRFIWQGNQLFQGNRYSVCPCSKNNKPHNNHVIDDIVFAKESNIERCIKLANIFHYISIAIQNSSNKKTRSSIRENLLIAILQLNDLILPQSIDNYIKFVKNNNFNILSK